MFAPVTPEAAMTAWIERQDGKVLPLTGNLSIGRTAANQLVVDDQRVSRRHAIIHSQGGEYWLVDLRSRNGTCVGERRIYQPVRLRDGDRIRICAENFTFHQPGNEPTAESMTQSAFHTRTEILAVQCWLLVADLEGSTALAQSMPADQLAMMLGQWFQACRALIEESNGFINKYLGDGFLAFWRQPVVDQDTLASTIVALRGLQQKGTPRFRFVLHRGEVLFNSAFSSLEENLSGASLSFVFRMEKLAPTLGQNFLLSEPAADGLKGRLELSPLGEHGLSGFVGKFPLFTLKS
jgi:class 3 adenylate cyclase